jgi:hypothetical protein
MQDLVIDLDQKRRPVSADAGPQAGCFDELSSKALPEPTDLYSPIHCSRRYPAGRAYGRFLAFSARSGLILKRRKGSILPVRQAVSE